MQLASAWDGVQKCNYKTYSTIRLYTQREKARF